LHKGRLNIYCLKILKRKTDENHDFSGGFSRIVAGRVFHYGTKSIET